MIKVPAMSDHERSAVVSFAETPVAEISTKAAELASRGWVFDEQRQRRPLAHPRLETLSEPATGDYEAELREVMGNYWADLDPQPDAGS